MMGHEMKHHLRCGPLSEKVIQKQDLGKNVRMPIPNDPKSGDQDMFNSFLLAQFGIDERFPFAQAIGRKRATKE